MEKKNYLGAFDRFGGIPIGMNAYISAIRQVHEFKKNASIEHSPLIPLYLASIETGLAALILREQETQKTSVLEFYDTGDFLPYPSSLDLGPSYQFEIKFIEKTTIVSISKKHFNYLPKIFPECTHLYQQISASHLTGQLRGYLYTLIRFEAERLATFRQEYPILSKRLPCGLQLSYLKMQNSK
ncbi:Crp/Fnr family transcriptional regulator [Pedobacter psychrodurus]|uniref:Crp/Fnr family transcriptional regulator n=1 Tax=Pedobacter psychrodurus TaxID=2530456 RepID=A0A4R0Q2P5_9SPHI|nr:Crp/Fnr family transcriptional regulator [Pedobacter psychrodurus]TCD28623.1 Crp/Fnr family transcriptional regulator [Pedobacter psychrodurus]